jgi:iron complex outermembrane recepter protein
VLLAMLAAIASAQATAQDVVPPKPRALQLDPVLVTGNPLRSSDFTIPAAVLSGDELALRRGASIGETLNGQTGVSSTYFGPNANRPVIRGLDGDRVRMLGNSSGSLDASSLSFDHAVPIDPLVVERLEVLRGPAALMYGGNAIGGVVNAIDNRIPKAAILGVSGVAELRLGGAEQERAGSAILEAGNGGFALHVDAFGRSTSDLRVPRHTPVQDGTPLPEATTVRNSAARTKGAALGGSFTFPNGHLGLSVDRYDSRYGIVAEPDVVVDMKRDQWALSSEVRDITPLLRSLRGRLTSTRYLHQEIEGDGAVGTTFKTTGSEARFEAEHAALGPLRGVIGLQLEDFDFSALGAEAFVPSTRTQRQGLFVVEEMNWPLGVLNAGVRVERTRVHSDGDSDPLVAQFGPAATRRYTLASVALGNSWRFAPQWTLSSNLSSTGRAPTSFELFANGVHAATAAFERGDPNLGAERGNTIDMAVQWKAQSDSLRLGVFHSRFARYIALDASGATVDIPDGSGGVESFPEFVFRPVRARLQGVEAEARWRVATAPWRTELSGKLDLTRGTNLDRREPLPRVAPLRLTLGTDTAFAGWAARLEVEHSARQSRVPASDLPTAGHTLVNASLSRAFDLGGVSAWWFLRLTNLGDTLAYSASSVNTIRSLAPLPGRALRTGLRVNF